MFISPNRDWFTTSIRFRIITYILIEVIADSFLIFFPVRTTKNVDTIVSEIEKSIIVYINFLIVIGLYRAWINSGKGVKIFGEEASIVNRKPIEHLDCSLRDAYVTNLWSSRICFHEFDIGNIIILAHLCPAVFPILLSVELQGLVLLTIFCSSITCHPNIETIIKEM